MPPSQLESFLWGVADLIRDTFKRGKYQDVILTLTILRRLDCVLADTKEKVLKRQGELRGKGLENLDRELRIAAGFAFYNTSKYDFKSLCDDAPHLAANLRNYIAGFSPNMREVIALQERGPPSRRHRQPRDGDAVREPDPPLQRGAEREPRRALHAARGRAPDGGSPLRRRRGTPAPPRRGAQRLRPLLRLRRHAHDRQGSREKGVRNNDDVLRDPIAPGAEIHLFGQEVNPEAFAICKSDLLMKSEKGEDAERILFGSTLSNDRHAGAAFDYLIANPPYGRDWKRDADDSRRRAGGVR